MNALISMIDLMKYGLSREAAVREVLRRDGFNMERPIAQRFRPDLGDGVVEFVQEAE